MTRALIWTLRALGGLLLLLALVSGGAVLWLRGSLPGTDATPNVWGAIRLPRNQVLPQSRPTTGQTVIYRTGAVPDSS